MLLNRLRPLIAAVLTLLALILAIVALTQPKWFVCNSRLGYVVSFGLSSWSDTVGLSGSNCQGVWFDINPAVCNAGKATTGLAAVAVVLSGVALTLFILMAAWKRPSAMQTASHACVILGGVIAAMGVAVYVGVVSGDLGYGRLVNVCNVQPAPIALIVTAAILLWVSSCLICACCSGCNCDDEANVTMNVNVGIPHPNGPGQQQYLVDAHGQQAYPMTPQMYAMGPAAPVHQTQYAASQYMSQTPVQPPQQHYIAPQWHGVMQPSPSSGAMTTIVCCLALLTVLQPVTVTAADTGSYMIWYTHPNCTSSQKPGLDTPFTVGSCSLFFPEDKDSDSFTVSLAGTEAMQYVYMCCLSAF